MGEEGEAGDPGRDAETIAGATEFVRGVTGEGMVDARPRRLMGDTVALVRSGVGGELDLVWLSMPG